MKGLYVYTLMLLLALWGLVGCDETPTTGDNGDDPPKERWSIYGFEGQEVLQLRLFGDWLYAIIRGDAGLYRRNVRQDSSEWESLDAAAPAFLLDVYVDVNQPSFIMVSGRWVDQVDSTVHIVLVSWNDGATWAKADSGLAIVRGEQTLKVAPYSLEGASGRIYASSDDGLFVTENAGESWDSLWVSKSLGYYSLAYFVVHPTNPQYMWRLFGPAEGWNPAPNVEYSTDEGKSWKRITDYSRSIFTWPTDIDLHPEDANVVYVTTEDSLFKTLDGGATWSQMAKYDSAESPMILRTSVDPDNPEHLLMVAVLYYPSEDTALSLVEESFDGGSTWIRNLSPYDLYYHWQVRFDPLGQALYIGRITLGRGLIKYDASP